MRRWPALAVAGCLLLISVRPSNATTVVVPDQVPAIQTAIDMSPDTVIVRSGAYAERPVVSLDLVLIGEGPTKPLLDGLDVLIREQQERIIVDGFHVKGLARLITRDESTEFFGFRRCVFDSGFFQDWSDIYDVIALEFRECRVTGAMDIQADNAFNFIGNVCDGPISIWASSFCRMDIRENAIRAEKQVGWRIGFSIEGDAYGVIRDNLIQNFPTGLQVQTTEGLQVLSNRILDCPGAGLALYGGQSFLVRDNVVLRCGAGIDVLAEGFQVIGNVVGRSTHIGIEVGGNPGGGQVSNNTVYLSGGLGFRVSTDPYYSNLIDHNIGYQNGSFGLASVSPNVTLSCNNWFGNGAGAVSPTGPGATDLAEDPLFCDVSVDSVHLHSSSALLDPPGCGLIGARGEGCDYGTGVLDPHPVAEALRFELAPVVPQPSSGAVDVRFSLARDARIELAVLDVQGREVARLAEGFQRAGSYTVRWGQGGVAPGVYFLRYRHPQGVQSRAIIRVR